MEKTFGNGLFRNEGEIIYEYGKRVGNDSRRHF